jgi:hypothetical protein
MMTLHGTDQTRRRSVAARASVTLARVGATTELLDLRRQGELADAGG